MPAKKAPRYEDGVDVSSTAALKAAVVALAAEVKHLTARLAEAERGIRHGKKR